MNSFKYIFKKSFTLYIFMRMFDCLIKQFIVFETSKGVHCTFVRPACFLLTARIIVHF